MVKLMLEHSNSLLLREAVEKDGVESKNNLRHIIIVPNSNIGGWTREIRNLTNRHRNLSKERILGKEFPQNRVELALIIVPALNRNNDRHDELVIKRGFLD